MQLSTMAHQIVGGLENSNLEPPKSNVTALLKRYQLLFEQLLPAAGSVSREDFAYPQKLQPPVSISELERLAGYYGSFPRPQFCFEDLAPDRFDCCFDTPETAQKVKSSLNRMAEALHYSIYPSNMLFLSILNEARGLLTHSSNSRRTNPYTDSDKHYRTWATVPLPVYGRVYLTQRFTAAARLITSLLYSEHQGWTKHQLSSNYVGLALAVLACTDPGLAATRPEDSVPQTFDLHEAVLRAQIEQAIAFEALGLSPSSIAAPTRLFVDPDSRLLTDRFPHLAVLPQHRLQSNIVLYWAQHASSSNRFAQLDDMVVYPVAADRLFHWLATWDNTEAILSETARQQASSPLPTIGKKSFGDEVYAVFLAPQIIGVANLDTRVFVAQLKDRNLPLPTQILALRVREANSVCVPLLLGTNRTGLQCLLTPHHPGTLALFRRAYGIEAPDPLLGYGPVTRQLLHPSASAYAQLLAAGKWHFDFHGTERRFTSGSPNLVDIRPYFGQAPTQGQAPPDADIFWELPIVLDRAYPSANGYNQMLPYFL